MKLDGLSRTQIETLIDEWIIGAHAERDRAILKHRLLDGLTFERLAEKHELSVRQTKTIVYKREQTLFKHIPGISRGFFFCPQIARKTPVRFIVSGRLFLYLLGEGRRFDG